MPLGDFFRAEPALVCPLCAAVVAEWEGFGGPGAFLLFVQGEATHQEARLASQVPAGEILLEDGAIPLFATCTRGHCLLAEAAIQDGVFVGVELRDVDGGMPLPLVGGFVLWRSQGSRFAVSSLAPTEAEGVVPASITAIGFDDRCVVATRRGNTRDPKSIDEWFVVDVDGAVVAGPFDDAGLDAALEERGFSAPDVMKLPEEIRHGR